MKKILLFAAAAMIAFAACDEKPAPTPGPTPGDETCDVCGKNPCECPQENDYVLTLEVPVQLQHEVNTNYGGTVVSVDGAKVLNFFGMTEEEFYHAMGSLDDNKSQVDYRISFGVAYEDLGEIVYDWTPSTSNNFGHWVTKDGKATVWGSEEAPHYMFTENQCRDWGLEDPTTVEGFSYDSMWQFAFGIEPGAYDLNVGDKLSFMEFYYDNESEKTCYIKWNLEIVDFIDTEADNYKGAPSSKESELALTVGTPVALQAMQEAFQLSKFQFNQALNAGQISTENFIDGEKVEPSAGGFGGVWFDAEGKRTVWGAGAEDNPETPDVNEAATPACYYIELISSATDLSAYSNYYAEDSAAQVAGKTFNNFKQVVTYTPAEGESYTFTINYTVTF